MRIIAHALAFAFLFWLPAKALADCANPAGVEGEWVFNGDSNVPQVCTPLGWVAVGAVNPAAGGGGCSNPSGTESEVLYNYDYHVPQYCDGDDWIAMIGTVGSVGGIASPTWQTIALAFSGGSVCGITNGGEAWCWGRNNIGQLGNEDTADQAAAVRLGTSGSSTLWSDWTQIVGSSQATFCGIRSNGEAYCWGANNNGKIGNGNSTNQDKPTRVGTGGTSTLWSDWESISLGENHTCGIRTNGEAYCWGNGGNGQLGNGTTTASQTTPVRVGTGGTSTLWSDWASIAASGQHSCGIRDNGTAWCWGNGNDGQLGDGNTTDPQTTPVQVGTSGTSTLWSDWESLSGGYSFTCGIRTNGEAYCWGDGSNGEMGNGVAGITGSPNTTPKRVGTSGTSTLWSDWANISANGSAPCGLRDDGTIWCWGNGDEGGLGNGTQDTELTPVQVGTTASDTLWTDWGQITSNGGFGCGIRSGGTVWCWGGLYGYTNADVYSRSLPMQVGFGDF